MKELLASYKHLVNFEDKMQKDNYKFVESYIGFYKRKNRPNWEEDCIDFLKGAIKLQEDMLLNIQNYKLKYQ